MTPSKRVLDIVAALVLGVPLLPIIAVIALVILIRDGRPVFYLSERMQTPTRGFLLWKFRTMSAVAQDFGVSGGDKNSRITQTGAFLRRNRLDELPQLWNVLKGDISFVGPRPPLRRYVEKFPDVYAQVLRSRPGITGMATIFFHRHEERLLKHCKTPQETEEVYERRCIPRKVRLDLIYQTQRTLALDVLLMIKTVFRRVRIH